MSSRWRPRGVGTGPFERLPELLGGDAWLVGCVTGQELAKGEALPDPTNQTYLTEPCFARRDAEAWGVVPDAHSKIA